MVVKVIRPHKNEQKEKESKKKDKKKRKVKVKKINRVGIDLGSGRTYATVYYSKGDRIKTYVNYLFKNPVYEMIREINFLQSKTVLTTSEINKIDKLKKKVIKESHKMVRDIIINVLSYKPDIITIENIDIDGMKYSNYNNNKIKDARKFNNFIDMCDFKYFEKYLNKKCKKRHIKLRKADSKFPSTKLCHYCGGWNYVTNEKQFNCTHCGKLIIRDENSAKLLSRYDVYEYEKYLYNKSKKYYK